jgi:DHA2 family multidrug resistance protein
MLVLRGFSLGLVGQPLILAALVSIRPHLLTQASSLSTVVRSVASSLGIAVLATVVQTQTQVHYAHLAEQVTPTSSLGQLLPRLQAYLMTGGASLATARTTALQLIAELVQRQSYMLAIRDAFLLTLVFVFLSVVATLFLQGKRKMLASSAPQFERPATTGEAEAGAVEREAALVGV